MPTTCTACHKPLTDPETFGAIDCPMCWTCHSSAMFDGDPPTQIDAEIYGLEAEITALEWQGKPCLPKTILSDAAQQEAAGQMRLW